MSDLSLIESQALSSIESITTLDELIEWKNNIIGKNGSLTAILKTLKDAPIEVKASLGKESNALRIKIEQLYSERESGLKERAIAQALEREYSDLTEKK